MDSGNLKEILTVSALNDRIKALLEEGFALVWVEGEVSNLRRPASGHRGVPADPQRGPASDPARHDIARAALVLPNRTVFSSYVRRGEAPPCAGRTSTSPTAFRGPWHARQRRQRRYHAH